MRKRLTDWQIGDTLRVVSPIRCISKQEVLQPGTLVTLGSYQRVQDGIEMWCVWQGAKSWGACHTQLEPCVGPVRWRSPLETDSL